MVPEIIDKKGQVSQNLQASLLSRGLRGTDWRLLRWDKTRGVEAGDSALIRLDGRVHRVEGGVPSNVRPTWLLTVRKRQWDSGGPGHRPR